MTAFELLDTDTVMALNNTTTTSYSQEAIEAGIPRATVVTLLCLISFFSVVGNSFVCVAIWQQPRLRTVMYLPLFSLAVADLLCGAVAMPAYIAKKFVDGRGMEVEGIVCDVFRFTYFFTEYASISSLVIVSIERMYTLKFPYKVVHTTFLRKIVTLLILAWLDAFLVAVLPFVPWNAHSGPCSYNPTKWWSLMVIHKNVFIPFLVVIACYGYIYKVAVFHLNTIQKENRPSHCRVRTRVQDWGRRRKATSTLFIVVGVFLLCWLPSSIYYYVHNVCEHCFDSFVGERESIFNAVVKILTFFNSMTNPIIYGWRSKEFRHAFRKMFLGEVRTVSPGPSNSKIQFGRTSLQGPEASRD